MPFSAEPRRRNSEETAERTGADYLKFSEDYRTVIRVLDPEAREVYKHYFPQGNGGKGFGAVCLGWKDCPSEISVADLPREDEERKNAIGRRKFLVNVLDRTPYTTCPHCNSATPGKIVKGSKDKLCVSCGGSLKGADFAPLNKVKVLEQGPKLFNEQLNPIEQAQLEEHDVPITGYDISISAQGKMRDRVLSALPQPPKELEADALIDKETGEPQVLFDLDLLATPPSVEEFVAIMNGATVEQLAAIRDGV